MENQTVITEFLLLGFSTIHNFKYFIFAIFLIFYIATLIGNSMVIATISCSRQLHSPMYFFLCNLSLSEILFITNITPKMLLVTLKEGDSISVPECISQLLIMSALTNTECSILTVMSYDRFLAICKPLHYSSIMDWKLQLHLALWSWILSFMATLCVVLQIYFLQFCGPSEFDHYYCDFAPIIKHSCSDTYFLELEAFLFSTPITLFPFIFIIVTYICIFIAIHQITSSIGRQKAFSTCSSHMAVVSLYYGTLVTIYVVPAVGHIRNINKLLSLLYTVVTPLLNPVVYSIRNHEIRMALAKFLFNKIFFF
ncbi:hypothetical protein XENTR_v10005878 [Xenopus tropicalis]|nr:hypothetical protein XENTR_v10005878 [Xenopus tropicalis]